MYRPQSTATNRGSTQPPSNYSAAPPRECNSILFILSTQSKKQQNLPVILEKSSINNRLLTIYLPIFSVCLTVSTDCSTWLCFLWNTCLQNVESQIPGWEWNGNIWCFENIQLRNLLGNFVHSTTPRFEIPHQLWYHINIGLFELGFLRNQLHFVEPLHFQCLRGVWWHEWL